MAACSEHHRCALLVIRIRISFEVWNDIWEEGDSWEQKTKLCTGEESNPEPPAIGHSFEHDGGVFRTLPDGGVFQTPPWVCGYEFYEGDSGSSHFLPHWHNQGTTKKQGCSGFLNIYRRLFSLRLRVNWNDVLDLQAPYAPAWVSSLNPSSLPLLSQKGPQEQKKQYLECDVSSGGESNPVSALLAQEGNVFQTLPRRGAESRSSYMMAHISLGHTVYIFGSSDNQVFGTGTYHVERGGVGVGGERVYGTGPDGTAQAGHVWSRLHALPSVHRMRSTLPPRAGAGRPPCAKALVDVPRSGCGEISGRRSPATGCAPRILRPWRWEAGESGGTPWAQDYVGCARTGVGDKRARKGGIEGSKEDVICAEIEQRGDWHRWLLGGRTSCSWCHTSAEFFAIPVIRHKGPIQGRKAPGRNQKP
ncbi:hypothetical protein B0H13DRAFT_1887834 [Mycena leptocephala]|nr:hypothetical protein B0H13DRAFT_1887834 [Mycena leptocephala]